MPEIISRKEAIKRGLKRFFTGKPCPRGHVALRYLASKKCIECARAEQRIRWKKKCPDLVHLGELITCKICDVEFIKTERCQKTCSTECKKKNALLLGRQWKQRLPTDKREKILKQERDRARVVRLNRSVEQRAVVSQKQSEQRLKERLALRALKELGIEV